MQGYFSTLERNDGEIRGTCFIEDAIRRENGLQFDQIKAGFESGRYFFNNEVRNWPILVDEERQVALSRGFIDHKGVLDEYTLTDGTETRSIFREPHSWAFLEMFAVRDGCIDSVVATFITTHYKHPTPWNPEGIIPSKQNIKKPATAGFFLTFYFNLSNFSSNFQTVACAS